MSPDLLGPVAAIESHVVEAGVVQALLVLLHLGLDATDASLGADGAPKAILPPAGARAVQHGVAAAAKADVVDSCVIAEQTLVGLHTQLEGLQNPPWAVLGLGPLSIAVGGMKSLLGV